MRRLLMSVLVGLTLGGAAAAPAVATRPSGQVVIVVVGGFGLADLRSGPMPFTRSLVGRSAVGLANMLGVGRAEMNRSTATIGAGARADMKPLVDPAMNASETIEGATAAEVYRRRTGYGTTGYAVLDVGLPTMDAANHGLPYHMVPGALGDAVREAGGAAAVYGNADTSLGMDPANLRRDGVRIAMDAKGRVKYGDVGESTVATDVSEPYGVMTDSGRLLEGYRSVRQDASLVVLEFGDVLRTETYRPFVRGRVAARQRRDALERADGLLARLVPQLRPDSVLVVLSPVGPEAGGANSLTPIIVSGARIKPGLLVSPVTQRRGLVNATDIAPTALGLLGLPPRTEFLGAQMASAGSSSSGVDRIGTLVNLYDRASAEAALRSTVTGGFTLLLSLVLIGVVWVLFSKHISARAAAICRWLLLAVISVPLAAYLMWFLRPANSPRLEMIGVFAALVIVLPSLAVLRSRSSTVAIVKVCSATVVFIAIDQVLFAGRLTMSTFYGYSPVDGARYYGIGNETWAIMIGALVVGTALMIDEGEMAKPLVDWGLPALYAATVFMIGFPALGANAGGVIGATATLATAYLYVRERKIGIKEVVIVVLAIVLMLGLFTVYDALRPVSVETHIGRSAKLIVGKNGVGELALLFQRKLASNVKVMSRTRWSYVLLLILAVLALLRRRPTGLFAETLSCRQGLTAALTGGLVGGFTGLITEDSGVVIPAMIMLFVGVALTMAMVETKVALQTDEDVRRAA